MRVRVRRKRDRLGTNSGGGVGGEMGHFFIGVSLKMGGLLLVVVVRDD
jgi:hypothetical protein